MKKKLKLGDFVYGVYMCEKKNKFVIEGGFLDKDFGDVLWVSKNPLDKVSYHKNNVFETRKEAEEAIDRTNKEIEKQKII